jgi:ribonuclease-3
MFERKPVGLRNSGTLLGQPPARIESMEDTPNESCCSSDDDQLAQFQRCERRIGYRFRDTQLLREALTHASGADHRLASNERLEFLGDAILGAVVCELLFERYPDYLEGDLTKIKSVVVSRQSCAKISEALGLQEFLIVGKGVAAARCIPPSLLADVLESLVAAIYLDGGNEAARQFIEQLMGPEIELAATGELGGNYKSLLQQLAQREFSSTPTYQLMDEKGPDHRKCFKIAARVGGVRYQAAWGRNKKEAEQRAACNALAELNGEPAQFPSD